MPSLIAALQDYEEALFVGSDIVIVDPSDDVPIEPDAWQALVEHHTGDGVVPNADMWYVRRPMIPLLEQMWGMTQYIQHGWWEQRALHDLMGYRGRPVKRVAETELYRRTTFLDPGWNVHCWDAQEPDHPRFQHATMWPDRAVKMREWAAQAARVVV